MITSEVSTAIYRRIGRRARSSGYSTSFDMKTEKAKMLAGELYDPLDIEISRERQRCRDLCKLLNDSREDEQEERRRILNELFGYPNDAWVQPPFFCDYGYNIALGSKVFFNFN